MYEIIWISLASLILLYGGPASLKKYSTSLPLILYTFLRVLMDLSNTIPMDPEEWSSDIIYTIFHKLVYSEYHSICLNFICWLQIIPFLYFSPDLTFAFHQINLIQYNYAAFLIFELEYKFKFYYLINVVSLLCIQYSNGWIDLKTIFKKSTEAGLQLVIMWASYDIGFNPSAYIIFRNFFVPMVSFGLALFLEFFIFIYFFETLTDYRNFNFPSGARIKKLSSSKEEQVCGDRIRFIDILSHTYLIPTFFLIFFRFISSVSNYAMVHILVLISFPLSFKLCMITNQFEYKNYALNTAAIYFGLHVWWTLIDYFPSFMMLTS